MSIPIPRHSSRPLAVAETLLKRPISPSEVAAKRVVLTGELSTLATSNGRWCLVDALRLLSRFPGELIVALPGDGRAHLEATELTQTYGSGSRVLTDARHPHVFDGADAILNVGHAVRTDLPWTSINCDGWVARVSSRSALPSSSYQPNPIAALLAASFGATEIFKRVLEVPEEAAPLLGATQFSLFELTSSPHGLGPPLPARIALPDTLLTGAGAIGNGIALLMSHLPVEGCIHLIDRQNFAIENLETCVLMDSVDWLDQPKAEKLGSWLAARSNLTVTAEKIDIQRAIAEERFGSLSEVMMALNALDDSEARRQTQRLWPHVVVDGGINALGAAVIQHRADRAGQACLMCWFASDQVDECVAQSAWTGLPLRALDNTGRLISEDDISAAVPEKRDWLRERQRQGKNLCAVITEAQLAQQLNVSVSDGFRPSAPFIATASAAFVVAAALKACLFPNMASPALFQMANLFLGPDHATSLERSRSTDCLCAVHSQRIEQLHAIRHQKSPVRA